MPGAAAFTPSAPLTLRAGVAGVDLFQATAVGGPAASLPGATRLAAGATPAPDDTAMPWLDGLSVCAVALLHLLFVTGLLDRLANPSVPHAPPKVISVSLTAAPLPEQRILPREPFAVPVADQPAPPPLAMTPSPTRPKATARPVKSKARPKPSPPQPVRTPEDQRPVERQSMAATPSPRAARAAPLAESSPPAITPPVFSAAYLDNPVPAYPSASRRNGESGVVRLRVQVSADGRALEVTLQSGSGHQRLDEAAARAVRTWRFVPARRGDMAVAAWVIVPIAFRLNN